MCLAHGTATLVAGSSTVPRLQAIWLDIHMPMPPNCRPCSLPLTKSCPPPLVIIHAYMALMACYREARTDNDAGLRVVLLAANSASAVVLMLQIH